MRLGMAGQKLRGKLGGNAGHMSEEFNSLNANAKATRATCSSLRAECAAFQRSSTEYATALARFLRCLRDLSLSKDYAEILGEPFVDAFGESQAALQAAVDTMGKQMLSLILGPLDDHIEAQLNAAKDAKQECYDALHERNVHAQRVEALSGSGNSGKLERARASYEEASSNFNLLQQGAVNRFSDSEQEVDFHIMESLASVVAVQHDAIAGAEAQLRLAAAHASPVVATLADKRKAYAEECANRDAEFEELRALAAANARTPSSGVENEKSWAVAAAGLREPGEPTLLPGEAEVRRVNRVVNMTTRRPGLLVVTNYALRFQPYILDDDGGGDEASPAAGAAGTDVASVAASDVEPPPPPARASWRCSVCGRRNEASPSCAGCSRPRTVPDSDGAAASQTSSTEVATAASTQEAAGGAGASSASGRQLVKGRSTSAVTRSLSDANHGFELPLLSVARIEQLGDDHGLLAVWCHNLRSVRFSFRYADQTVHDTVEAAAPHLWIVDETGYFALSGRPASFAAAKSTERASAAVYVPADEFRRQGVDVDRFALSPVNGSYTACATYPAALLMPTTIGPAMIAEAALFRTKGRLPTVVWSRGPVALSRSSQPKSGMTGRTSRPDEALLAALATPVEAMTVLPSNCADEVARGVISTDVDGTRLAICDARPRINAIGNKGKGGGAEDISRYRDCKLEFLGIDNIHVVRDALASLKGAIVRHGGDTGLGTTLASSSGPVQASRPKSLAKSVGSAWRTRSASGAARATGDTGPGGDLEGASLGLDVGVSGELSARDVGEDIDLGGQLAGFIRSLPPTTYTERWFKLCSTILAGSVRVAACLQAGVSVLVHCSDGWDRTAQLCGLAQVMLDPYYRTIRGFAVIVEKEWCSFGHQFARRCGTGCGPARANFNDRQRSPIFLQFLDCLWQIVRQFPRAFEYGPAVIAEVARHVDSGRFGTFLFDCERLRGEHGALPPSAPSLWSWLLHDKQRWVNPEYEPAAGAAVGGEELAAQSDPVAAAIWPTTSLRSMRLWPWWVEQWVG